MAKSGVFVALALLLLCGDMRAQVETGYIQGLIDSAATLKGKNKRVVFKVRTYVTGTLVLKSGVELYLPKGCVMKASENLADFPEMKTDRLWYIGRERHHYRAMLYAENAQNISIIGEGVIDGNGHAEAYRTDDGRALPERFVVLRFYKCKKVEVAGITLQHSPSWMQHYAECENISIKKITVDNWGNRNNDGLDLDGCQNVTLSDCRISSEDDAICIKTLGLGPCHNIKVRNCKLSTACNAIKVGTETEADVSALSVDHITIVQHDSASKLYKRSVPLSAIALLAVDGARLSKVRIMDVKADAVYVPIFIRAGNRNRRPMGFPQVGESNISDVRITNVKVCNATRCPVIISGSPQSPVRDVTLEDIDFTYVPPPLSTQTWDLPALDKAYPEATQFGYAIPASKALLRHVAKLKGDFFKDKKAGDFLEVR